MKETAQTHWYQTLDGWVKEIYSHSMGEAKEKTTPRTAAQAINCTIALLMLVAANLCLHSSIAQAATSVRLAGGTLTSTPTSGPTQATLAVSGSGWQNVSDGTVVNFGFSTDPSCAAASYTQATTEQAGVMSGGAFSGWFLWPTSTPVGAYTVCASIGSTPAVAAGSYTVLSAAPPRLTISSTTFNVGQQAMVSGSNFLPPQKGITLALQQLNGGTSIPLGTVTSDTNGAFSQTFTIPANPTGPVELIASAGSSTPPTLSASVTFIVYAAPVTPTPTPSPVVTPTPSPAPSPSPSPTPGRTATPTPGKKTATPTPIPPQQTKVVPTPTATPISLGTQPQAPTPTSSSSEPTQQPVAHTSAIDSKQSSGKQAPALVAGAVFVLLAAALAVLMWRRKAKKGVAQPAALLYQAIPGAGSLDPTSSWGMAQLIQPSSSWMPGPGWGDLPFQQASSSLPVQNSNTNGNPSLSQATATHMYRRNETPEMPAMNGGYGSGEPVETPDLLPVSATTAQSGDLLQEPLLAAIMQQARGGLFVLPGKRP